MPIEEVKTHPVHLTIACIEDLRYASFDIKELIKQRIVQVTNEAFDQVGLLTQAQLGYSASYGTLEVTMSFSYKYCLPEEDQMKKNSRLRSKSSPPWKRNIKFQNTAMANTKTH